MEYKICNIVGYEGRYYIYENGDIYLVSKKRMLRPRQNVKKYKYLQVVLVSHYTEEYVQLHKEELIKVNLRWPMYTTSVHRLVAHHWISPEPEPHPLFGRYEVDHIDGDASNNHYSNLQWITHQKNMLKARQQNSWKGGIQKGYKHTLTAKEKMSEAKKIRVLLYNTDKEDVICESIEDAATFLGVSRRTVERHLQHYKTIKGYHVRKLDK
jgi:hypothetical protein